MPIYECQWDDDKNDPLKKRRIKLKMLLHSVMKIVLENRVKTRIEAFYKKFPRNATKEEAKKIIDLDWQKAEYAGIGKKDHINFSFEFEEHNIARDFFPIQYESSNTYNNFKFDVNPRTGFDDWAPIEPI